MFGPIPTLMFPRPSCTLWAECATLQRQGSSQDHGDQTTDVNRDTPARSRLCSLLTFPSPVVQPYLSGRRFWSGCDRASQGVRRVGLQPHAYGEIARYCGASPLNGPYALRTSNIWAKSFPFDITVVHQKGYVDADPDVLQVRSPSFRTPTYTLFGIRMAAGRCLSALPIRQGQCYKVED